MRLESAIVVRNSQQYCDLIKAGWLAAFQLPNNHVLMERVIG